MSDFRQEPSLDAIRLSDEFVDALAGNHAIASQDSADAELAALLGGWRDEMRWPPATGLITESQAIAALDAGLSDKRKRDPGMAAPLTAKRRQRSLSMIGVAAAAVLCIGGFGAVVAGAGPGDALYGLRTMMFGTPKQVREQQVGLAARTELNQVQELIDQGDWQQAQEKLVAVSSQVESIDDAGQKQQLVEQFNDLSAKVVERDPAATAPPGVTYTVSESSTQLVPTVAPTSVPSAPSSASAPETPSGDSVAPESPAPSEPSLNSENPMSEAVPDSETSSVPPAVTSGTTSAATAPTTVSGQTTTPTSAAPTTTMAPKVSSLGPSTSVAPSPATQTPAQQASTAQDGPQTLPPSITTTVVTPAPVG